jgi:hypothetical protein
MNPTGAFFLGVGVTLAVECMGAFLAWLDWQPTPQGQAKPRPRRHLIVESTDIVSVRPRDPEVVNLVDYLAERAESQGDHPGGRAS